MGNRTQSLDRAIEILRVVSEAGRTGIGAKDVGAATGLSPATVYRNLQALQRHGLVTVAARLYRIGRGALFLAAAAFEADPLHELAKRQLRQLAQATGCSVVFLVSHGTRAMCAARAEGAITLRHLFENVGSLVTLGIGPGTLCLMAGLSGDQLEAAIAANRTTLIGKYYPDELSLREALSEVQACGYARDPGEIFPDVFGLGVQVLDDSGHVLGAIGISLVRERIDAAREAKIISLMQSAAAKIAANANPVAYHMSPLYS